MQINLKSYLELDARKKTPEWANTIVGYLRTYARPIVNAEKYRKNMAILRGDHDMISVKKLFKDPKLSGASFIPIAVMEKLRNVIIAENENAGIHITLHATDPTAVNQKQKDRELLANRKLIEKSMTDLSTSIGLPPFTLKGKKNQDGKPLFNGNADGFDKHGLSDTSDEDLDYFFSTFYRLTHEIIAEKPINFFVAYNELTEMIALLVNDILACKRIAVQAYVDEVEGAVKYRYLCPANVKAIKGKRRDFKDATALVNDQEMAVGEFIKLIGNEFDYDRDMPLLLQAVNSQAGTTYSCVCDDGGMKYFGDWGTSLLYEQFLELKVVVGYVEWKSIDADMYKVTQSNTYGNPAMIKMDVWDTRKVGEDSRYRSETWYSECTYKAYYLSLTSTTQKLYKYGKLSYQMIEGSEDEYSNFSICAYAEWGKPAVEVAEPFIENIQKAWQKFEHMIAAAKPPGRAYNYESLVKIAQHMFAGQDIQSGVDSVLKMFFDGINEIWSIPTTEDDKPIGGSGQSSFALPNGLDKSVIEFKNIVDYNFSQINEMLGISNLRDAGTPDPRDGYKLSMQALQYSHNATQYVRSILINVLNNIGKRTLFFVQSIIRFRELNPTPYKFLLTALGDETISSMDTLFDVALHRYGIFVEALNTQYEQESIRAMATQALANKEIEYHQLLLITSERNPKEAARILSYEKKRKERMDMQQKQLDYQQVQAMKQLDTKEKVDLATIKGQENVAVADRTGMWNYKIKELEVQGQVQKQTVKTDAEPNLIAARTEGNIKLKEAQADLEAQKPLVS